MGSRVSEIDGVEVLKCSCCNEYKSPDDFYKSKHGLLGRQHRCINCAKIERLKKLGRTKLLINYTFFKEGIPYKKCQSCDEDIHLKKFLSTSGRKYAKCKTCRYLTKAKAYKDNGRIYKQCKDCKSSKLITNFSKNGNGNGYFGRKNVCKYCMRKRYKRYRGANPELATKRSRDWRIKNPEKMAESKREWRLRNPEKERAQGQRRRARIKALDNTLSDLEWRLTCEIFGDRCALTGSPDITMDHFIPVSTGYGGTHGGNVYPLCSSLNFSKHNRNPFEWFHDVKERFDLDEDRFNKLIGVLAALNCMRTNEFREYVESIFEEVNDET